MDEPSVRVEAEERPLVLWVADAGELAEYGPLLRQRFRVHVVPDGPSALAAARRQAPDLVLSGLATGDDFAWLRALRDDPALRAIPIILLAALTGEPRHIEGIAAGADDVMLEPQSAAELVARVEAQIQLARLRREASTAVRESESRSDHMRALLGAIVDSSDDAIISKDLNGIITSWNASAERMFGYSAAEAVGRPVTLLIPPDRLDEEPRILDRLKRGQRMDHFETVRVRKDGTTLDISLTISPIKDRDGRIVGASKVARDISDRKRSEEELLAQRAVVDTLYETERRLRREAEEASRAKDEFLAMLGHELRNPLAAISNAVSAADVDPSYGGQALTIVRRGVAQLSRLVDDLLDVARITQGKIDLRWQRVSLGEIVQNALETMRPALEARALRLALSLPHEPVELEGDAIRLEQVVVNLLSNAAKFTGPGGKVWITVERIGGWAVLRVKDDGIGIAPALLPRIFDLFAQGSTDLARASGGLGIGLTIVRRIAELHGGTAEARSEGPGAGAEFVLRLPAQARGDRPAPRARVDAAAGQRSLRVLLVEDNPDTAESMAVLLERLGHRVMVVRDGPSAVETARREEPELMLVDIGLPGMDGYEVARRLRGDGERAGLVLVALTGYGGPQHRERALAAGFDLHLTKPVDPFALRDLIARLTR